jgi:hypothetical protein
LTDNPSPRAGHGINHLGYRGWSGRQAPGWTRWTVISAVGVRRAWQSRWVRRLLFFAWLPAMWFGLGFFIWEQASLNPAYRDELSGFLQSTSQSREFNDIRLAIDGGDWARSRHAVWALLLQSFFRYPQGVLMVMVVGLIAPPLISQDIRSRAFLLYFSRPLTRGEYLLGKLAVLWAYLVMISTAPALALYTLGLLLSPDLGAIGATWDIPLRIVAASVVLMLPTSTLALCFSSLTQESRYASFAWFAVWILGWFTYGAVTSAQAFNAPQGPDLRHGSVIVQEGGVPAIQESAWTHLSLYHTLGRVQRWVFGFAELRDVLVSLAILIAVTVISLAVVYRRIAAPMRA